MLQRQVDSLRHSQYLCVSLTTSVYFDSYRKTSQQLPLTLLTVNMPLPFLLLIWESHGRASSTFSEQRWKELNCQIINILREITPAMKYWKRKSQTWGHWFSTQQGECSYCGKKHTAVKKIRLYTVCESTLKHSDTRERNYSLNPNIYLMNLELKCFNFFVGSDLFVESRYYL